MLSVQSVVVAPQFWVCHVCTLLLPNVHIAVVPENEEEGWSVTDHDRNEADVYNVMMPLHYTHDSEIDVVKADW